MTGSSDRPAPGHAAHAAPTSGSDTVCDLCGAPTVEVRCKIICGRCGYTRDCSDP